MTKNQASEKNLRQIDIPEFIQSVKSWFLYLLKKWLMIGLICLVAGIAGFVVAYMDKPQYESRLTFALEDGDGGLGGALNLAAEFGFNIGGGSKNLFEGDNILALISSRRILERVLLSKDTVNGRVMTMAEYLKSISNDVNAKPGDSEFGNVSFPVDQPKTSLTYLQDSILLNMCDYFVKKGGLKASRPDKKLNLYEVTVTSPNERFSKVFTDKLINESIGFYVELKTKKSKQILDILENRVALTKSNLTTAINGRAGIQDANANPVFQQAQAELQKKQVDISAYGGAYGELYKNMELARFQFLKDIPLLQVIDAADYPLKKIKKGKLMTSVLYASIAAFISVLILSIVFFFKQLGGNVVTEKTNDVV